MKKTLFIFLILFFSCALKAEEAQYRIGLWDYKHETGGLAFNIKNITDNNIDILNFIELSQIYEFTGMIDKNDYFSKGDEIRREEYSLYFSSGVQKIIDLTDGLSLIPSFSAGIYAAVDDGKDMGFPINFKSEIELKYKLFNDSFLGLSMNHISNADIGKTNPGADSILITFRVKEKF